MRSNTLVLILLYFAALTTLANADCTPDCNSKTKNKCVNEPMFSPCTKKLWPQRKVPYYFDGTWEEDTKDIPPKHIDHRIDVLQAIRDWENATGGLIDFFEDSSATNHVKFVTDCCFSGLGMSGGVSVAQVFKGGLGVTRHELGHLIGLPHPHKRADRDRYVLMRKEMFCCPPDPPCNHCDTQTAKYCRADWDYDAYRNQLIGDNISQCTNGEGSDYGPFDPFSVVLYESRFPDFGDSGSVGCPIIDDPHRLCPADPAHTCPTDASECGMVWRDDGSIIPGNNDISAGDVSALYEMHAEQDHRWSKFRPIVSHDPGPTTPLDTQLTATVLLEGSPVLTSHGIFNGVMAIARGNDNHYYAKSSLTIGVWSTGYWTDVGGEFVSDPAVVSMGTNSLDLVVVGIGTDGNVWCKKYEHGKWESSATSLGRPGSNVPTTPAISAPAIVSWSTQSGADRMDIFVRVGRNIFHKTWSLESDWTSGWEDLGGIDKNFAGFQGKPAAVSSTDNRIDLFAVGMDNAVWHKVFDGEWKPQWQSLGGQVASDSGPAAISLKPVGDIEVYIASAPGFSVFPGGSGANTMGHHLLRKSLGSSGESDWIDLGGILEGSPAATTSQRGVIYVASTVLSTSHTGITSSGVWHRYFPRDYIDPLLSGYLLEFSRICRSLGCILDISDILKPIVTVCNALGCGFDIKDAIAEFIENWRNPPYDKIRQESIMIISISDELKQIQLEASNLVARLPNATPTEKELIRKKVKVLLQRFKILSIPRFNVDEKIFTNDKIVIILVVFVVSAAFGVRFYLTNPVRRNN